MSSVSLKSRESLKRNAKISVIWMSIICIKAILALSFWFEWTNYRILIEFMEIFITTVIGFNGMDEMTKQSGEGVGSFSFLILILIKNIYSDFIQLILIDVYIYYFMIFLFVKNILILCLLKYIFDIIKENKYHFSIIFHLNRNKNYFICFIAIIYSLYYFTLSIDIFEFKYVIGYLVIVISLFTVNIRSYLNNYDDDDNQYQHFIDLEG